MPASTSPAWLWRALDPPGNDDDKPILSQEEAKTVASGWQDLLANTEVCLTTSTRSGLLGPYALYLNHPRLYSPEACARSSRRQMYGIIIMVQVGLSCLSCFALVGVAFATNEEASACIEMYWAAFSCCSCCCVIPVICNAVRTPSLINWLQQQFQPSLACSLSGAKLYDAC
eukprot:COSAG06_NODE_7995_length_2307_cov_22.325634_2_plen_172_part_00